MKKRILSALMTCAMLFSLIPFVQTDAQAYAGSADGQAIVNKAREYVGKVPYVSGGTKIDGSNPGADCSGFVARLYEKFGYDFWDYRTSHRKYGVGIGTDMNKAKPGDLLKYDGHIAIYAGKENGKHMLVECTKGGGKVMNVIYRAAYSDGFQGVYQIPGVNGNPTACYGKISGANGSLSINNKAKSTSNGATQLGTIPNGKTCTVYTNKSSGQWWYVEYNGVKGWAHSKYITLTGFAGAQTTAYLDVNGFLNGKDTGKLDDSGTVDVYIDGKKVANDVNDYYVKHPVGTRYEITDIRSKPLWSYDGIRAGSLTGTIGSSGTSVRLSFVPGTNQYLDLNGWKDGAGTPNIEGYATVDLYINGTKVADDITDYYMAHPEGTRYEFKDMKVKEGYVFDGCRDGALSGTIGNYKMNVNLAFVPKTEAEEPPVLQSLTIQMQIGNPSFSVNGSWQKIDAQNSKPMINADNRTILPVRAVLEAMGGTVGWDGTNQIVSLTLDGVTLYLRINSNMMWDSHGKYYTMDTVPVIINSRTLLPIRPVVEYFGGSVGWNGNTQTVTIQYAP